MKKFFKENWRVLVAFTVYIVFLTLCTIGSSWDHWNLCIALIFPFTLAVGFGTVFWTKLHRKRTTADAHYWVVPFDLLNRMMPEYEKRMLARGYGRKFYKKEVNDCDDHEIAGRTVLHEMFEEMRAAASPLIPAGKADPLFGFSFERDDGKRHRLFFVETDAGRVYIDNYRIHGSMYRILSDSEAKNGDVL